MKKWTEKRLQVLAAENLCGYIFKSKSPSCGMERIYVYNETGAPVKKGIGIFARAFMEMFPQIPVEEDERLHDPKLRENFIEMIFTLERWRKTFHSQKQMKYLIDFHTRNKLLILSHNQDIYRKMGKLVAHGASMHLDNLYNQYEKMLLKALRLNTTVKKNINVLLHMMGYFKNDITPDEKKELIEIIDQYRKGTVPVIVPITIFNHYVRKFDQPYLKSQSYLHPHPVCLKLRNHA